MAHNTVSGSHGFGIFLAGTDDSRIQHNRLDGNDHGIAAFEGSSRNIVRHNAVFHSGGSAIDVGGNGATGNRVEHDRRDRDNGDGIVVGDPTRSSATTSWTGTMVLADGRFRGTNDQDDGEFIGTYEVFRDVLVVTEEVGLGEEVLSFTFEVNNAGDITATPAPGTDPLWIFVMGTQPWERVAEGDPWRRRHLTAPTRRNGT